MKLDNYNIPLYTPSPKPTQSALTRQNLRTIWGYLAGGIVMQVAQFRHRSPKIWDFPFGTENFVIVPLFLCQNFSCQSHWPTCLTWKTLKQTLAGCTRAGRIACLCGKSPADGESVQSAHILKISSQSRKPNAHVPPCATIPTQPISALPISVIGYDDYVNLTERTHRRCTEGIR